MKNLVQPESIVVKTYDGLVEVVKKHYEPKQSVIVQRYKFNTRSRGQDESVAAYVAALKALGEHCEFHSLEEMIRDRLVCGVEDPRMQRAMLQEADLSYQKAIELCTATELATKDISLLQQKPVDEVKRVHPTNQRQQRTPQNKQYSSCYCCGSNHPADACRFKSAECRFCKKIGHIAKVCKSRLRQPQIAHRSPKDRKRVNSLQPESNPPLPQDTPGSPGSQDLYTLFTTVGEGSKPIVLTVNVNGSNIPMELDTGASTSVISENTYFSFFRSHQLQPYDISLTSYTGQALVVLGKIDVTVRYSAQEATLPLIVVKGQGASLFGRNWLKVIKIDWPNINALCSTSSMATLRSKYIKVFSTQVGTLKGTSAKLMVDTSATPRFFKPRPVPYCLKEKVEKELNCLVEMQIIKPVSFSEWAAPIVPVVKQDGTIRICGDYKVTINRAAKIDSYPLPRIEDLFAALSGGKLFTKLDLSHAYQQVLVHEDSRKYTTINTHRGLFEFCRLPFGISAAPAIFQRLMDTLMQGLPKVCVYLDDILVSGVDESDHYKNLSNVLGRLEDAGLTLKESKCVFAVSSIEYLGHIIDGQGLHPSPTKIDAIKNAPVPTNVTELKSFIGLINYYHKFLPNFSTTLAPLYQLLHKDSKWKWTTIHDQAYMKAKEYLQSSSLPVHFDPQKPLILSCDASPYGIGAVLAHKMADNSEKPVAYISRTLAKAEKQYSQLEKEALAIVFAVKRFHQYLFGNHFILYSDHKPLESLLNESAPIPQMASSRIQRWALTLSAYNYTIQHRPGQNLANADAFSRLPLPETPDNIPVPGDVLQTIHHLSEHVVTAAHLKKWTDKDPVLSRVRKLVQAGWPTEPSDPQLRPYHLRSTEISVVDGCLLLGSRMIIPKEGRGLVLKQLHLSHPGICRMKSLARSYVWWPGIDLAIEQMIRDCHVCQLHRANPPKAPLHPWESAKQPWSRVHIDHAGPFLNKYYLILIDSFSKWLEIHIVPSTSSTATISVLRSIFATHGYPQQLVSDNASGFTSSEFKSFLGSRGVEHIQTSPYHASSNGLAERAVQIFKSNMKKLEGDLQTRIDTILFQYRITPQTTTGLSPAEMLMGRKLRNTLDLLHPRAKICRKFNIGDRVFARNYRGKVIWITASVIKVTGPCSYLLKSNEGYFLRRHIDQLRPCYSTGITDSSYSDDWPILLYWYN
jgi:transposase InsO family protein